MALRSLVVCCTSFTVCVYCGSQGANGEGEQGESSTWGGSVHQGKLQNIKPQTHLPVFGCFSVTFGEDFSFLSGHFWRLKSLKSTKTQSLSLIHSRHLYQESNDQPGEFGLRLKGKHVGDMLSGRWRCSSVSSDLQPTALR